MKDPSVTFESLTSEGNVIFDKDDMMAALIAEMLKNSLNQKRECSIDKENKTIEQCIECILKENGKGECTDIIMTFD